MCCLLIFVDKVFTFTPMKRLIIARNVVLVVCVLCLGVWGSDSDGAPMEEAEQAALYSAIQGFVGNWWNGSDLYPDPCGWTPIQGVSCDIFDGLWHVTSLSIGPVHENSLDCALNVEFRPELFQLEHLKSLSFFNCFVSPQKHPVTLPTNNWEKLRDSLDSLEFRSNLGLIGQIPVSFGIIRKLQSLVLVENGLSGELPDNLGDLTNLKRLVLSGNRFSSRIPDGLGGLRELLILDLSRNSLFGSLPLTIGGMTSLLKLDLSNNQLEGILPTVIGNLKNLTLLDLRGNKFSGGLTSSIQEMHSLEEMSLSDNPIGGSLNGLDWINLQRLVILDLSNVGLQGEIPESIVELKRLRFLGLGDNNLTGNLSPKLATLPSISALYLHGNNLTGEIKFSEWFYGKMGRRFGAWNNPNLCYPPGLMSSNHVPYGVKPCNQNVTFLEHNSNSLSDGGDNLNQNSHSMISLGLSSYGVQGFWWILSLEMLVLLLNL